MRRAGWVATAFGIGTIPTPLIVAALGRRGDVIAEMRRQDSPGDAHFLVARKMSGKLGGLAIGLDMLKGFLPALAARMSGQDAATLALVGMGATAGHSFAPFLRKAGGRGLTTAAGVSLVIVPKAMTASGVIGLAGTVTKRGGVGTGVGFGLLPLFAKVFGYERALVLMSAGIVGLIAIRRLEGLEEDLEAGVPLGRAAVGRLLFDLPRGRTK